MRSMIHAWLRYLSVAGLFSFCINLIYLVLPLYVMVVYDRVLYSFTRASLYALCFGVIISLAVMAVLEVLQRKMLLQAGRRLVLDMTGPVIRAMQGNPEYGRGLEDLETLRSAVVQGTSLWPLDLPWMVLYLWGLFLVHPLVGAVALGAVFLAGCAQALLFLLEQRQYTLADVAFWLNADELRAAQSKRLLVRGLGMLPTLLRRHAGQAETAGGFADQASSFHAFVGSFTSLVHHLGLAAVFTAGAFSFFSEEITGGAIFAAVLMAVRLFYPLQRGLDNMKQAVAARGAKKRLKAFVPITETPEKFSLPEPEGRLSVEQAGLAVAGKGILGNISFDLDPGQFLGVLGPSSSGKTALCRMVLGIWPLTSGKVRIDGAEIGHWPEEELGRHVGYLPQEPEIFEATVAENIARLNAPDPDKVVAAAKIAGIHEMILRLPQGYDTKVSPPGGNLSASQKQMISLARAVYDTPRLVVLDSPHTFIDEVGFRCLVGCLNQLKQEKTTVVMVTDKTNLLAGSDKILLLKEGQVAMYGPAKDVLAQLTGQQQAAAGV